MNINPNSPAFPRSVSQYTRSDGATVTEEAELGLSIRALIAKDLMAGFIAQGSDPACRAAIVEVATRHNKTPNQLYAEMACEAADALITQLNK